MAKLQARGRASALGSSAPALLPGQIDIAALVAALSDFDLAALRLCWRNLLGGTVPAHLPKWLLARVVGYRLQSATHGDLDKSTLLKLKRGSAGADGDSSMVPFAPRAPATRESADLKPGALLAREWRGKLERVTVLEAGFAWNGKAYGSLSQVANAITGTSWNGHRFFGLRSAVIRTDAAAALNSKARRRRSQSDAPDLELSR